MCETNKALLGTFTYIKTKWKVRVWLMVVLLFLTFWLNLFGTHYSQIVSASWDKMII